MRTKEEIVASWLAVAELPLEKVSTVPISEAEKAVLEQRLADSQDKLQSLSAELGTDFEPALFSGKIQVMRAWGEPHLSAYGQILEEIRSLPDFVSFACHLLTLASRELEPSITLRLVTRLTEEGNLTAARHIAKFGSVNRPGDRQYFYFRLLALATKSPEDVQLLRDAAEALDDEGEFHLAANAWVDVCGISADDADIKLARTALTKVPQRWSRAMSLASLGAFSADPADFAAAFALLSEIGKKKTMDILIIIDKVGEAIGSLKKESPVPLDRIYELIATVPDQRWRDNLRKQVRSSQPARA